MQKCVRCNRGLVPTQEYQIEGKPYTSRLCGSCAELTRRAHGEENVVAIDDTRDEGLPPATEVPPTEGAAPTEARRGRTKAAVAKDERAGNND